MAIPVVETVTIRIDRLFAEAGAVEQLTGGGFEQVERARDVDPVALGPAMRSVVPLDRHAGIARADAGIGKNRQQPLQGRRRAEQQLDPSDHVVLVERVGRTRGGDAQEARGSRHRISPICSGTSPTANKTARANAKFPGTPRCEDYPRPRLPQRPRAREELGEAAAACGGAARRACCGRIKAGGSRGRRVR